MTLFLFPPGKSSQIISYSPNLLPYRGRETRINDHKWSMILNFQLSQFLWRICFLYSYSFLSWSQPAELHISQSIKSILEWLNLSPIFTSRPYSPQSRFPFLCICHTATLYKQIIIRCKSDWLLTSSRVKSDNFFFSLTLSLMQCYYQFHVSSVSIATHLSIELMVENFSA